MTDFRSETAPEVVGLSQAAEFSALTAGELDGLMHELTLCRLLADLPRYILRALGPLAGENKGRLRRPRAPHSACGAQPMLRSVGRIATVAATVAAAVGVAPASVASGSMGPVSSRVMDEPEGTRQLDTKHIETVIEQYDVSDLLSYNCNNIVGGDEPCATECGLNECYRTSSKTGTTFPQDGFCVVLNITQDFVPGTDRYTATTRICLSSPNYPQGTGLMFNYQDNMNYEIVYKTRQDLPVCDVGYVQYGVVIQTDFFECGTTTADQWHRYTVTVYSDNTFEASLSTQAGGSSTSRRFSSKYPLSTRTGTLMVNDGSPGKLLQFDEITMTLTSINECSSSPCGSGGSCIDGAASYICNCHPGFTGVHCETDINECASYPCQNSGNCNNWINGYTCTCVPGYTGINCETDIDECVSSPCQNGGNCNNVINGYTCTCVPGYTGINCQTDINECASSPCTNGGSCNNLVGGYVCSCPPGFTGSQCETDTRCLGGYEFFDNSCYRFGKELLTWNDARSRCLADGADLVTIESQAEDDYLTNRLIEISCSNSGWIGLTDSAVEGDWRWIATGITPRFINWAPGEPNDTGNEDCASTGPTSGWEWNDYLCSANLGCYVCEV